RADFDSAEARYKKAAAGVAAAKANLQSARVAVGYALLRAPFDAVVLTKNADIGDIVSPLSAAIGAKAAVVTIADLGSLLVEVDVSESNIQKVRIGQPCEIMLDALSDKRFRGEVAMVVPTADRTKASVMVKVRFLENDTRVLPEMSAKVAFLERPVAAGEEAPLIVLKPFSILKRGARSIVFQVKDGHAVETDVTVGRTLGDSVEVLAGVKAGDKIVARPPESLRSGAAVVEGK
ncbi:MAG TPA: efflux RND transporter periplasmic adaptor subunit, partial [Dissulfurispiraceae bacterium]|nr:efflux RND transporter periplasmic adaptor subunit [Dissulfurispiraceae bacterium]